MKNNTTQHLSCSKDNEFQRFGQKFIFPLLKATPKKWTKYVDKLHFKLLCAQKGLPTFSTLWVFARNTELYTIWSLLPKSFVLKSNKASGRNIIVRDKSKTTAAKLIAGMKKWGAPWWNKHKEAQYEQTTREWAPSTFFTCPDINTFVALIRCFHWNPTNRTTR